MFLYLKFQRISSVKSLITRTVEKKKAKPRREQFCNNVYLDNKMQYEKNTSKDLQSADHDHPLKLQNDKVSEAQDVLNIDSVTKEMESVAIDWKPLRNTDECSCSLTLDQLSKKVNFITLSLNIKLKQKKNIINVS